MKTWDGMWLTTVFPWLYNGAKTQVVLFSIKLVQIPNFSVLNPAVILADSTKKT